MEYKDIEKVNLEIKKTDIKGKKYAEVSERVLAFRKLNPKGRIITEIVDKSENDVTMKATIMDENMNELATGFASEVKKGMVNSISMLENCETSAIGRALGFCGFGIDSGIASGQDMQKVEQYKQKYKKEEIYKDMFVSYDEALKIVKVCINDLCRRQGVVSTDLSAIINKELWSTLEELNLQQLKRLESELAKINNEKHKWHELYNQNSKIKSVVPENQEVIYQSSSYKFGQEALRQAQDDELLKSQIIDNYMELGVDLTKVIE